MSRPTTEPITMGVKRAMGRRRPIVWSKWLTLVVMTACAGCASVVAAQPASPPIEVQLRSPWPAAPPLVEILEAVHEERPAAFFDLLDRLVDPATWSTPLVEVEDRQIYQRANDIVEQHGLLPQQGQRLTWNASLALRTQLPRIAAHWQLYETSGLEERHRTAAASTEEQEGGTCESWVDFGGKVLCDANALASAIASNGGQAIAPSPPPSTLDHVCRQTTSVSSDVTAVLYADPYSSNFWSLHRTLAEHAQPSKEDGAAPVQYILRWKPTQRLGDTHLAGYGAYLDLKKVDYLVIDDRKLVDTAAARLGEAQEDRLAVGSIEQTDLDERRWLQSYLHATDDDERQSMGSLTADELRSLGVQAAHSIVQSKEPLRVLKQLSHDFPSHAVALARSAEEPPQLTVDALRFLHSTSIEQGGEDMWLNGKTMSAKDIQPLGLLSALRSERRLMDAFASIDVSPSRAIALLTSANVSKAYVNDASAPPPFFDASDRIERRGDAEGEVGAIAYWNDLEAADDQRYAFWPQEMRALLQPLYPGSFPRLRRNVFNIFIAMDLHRLETVQFLSESVQMATGKVGLRWGFVPINLDGNSAQDQSSQLADLFWLAFDQLEDPSVVAKWLRRLAHAMQQEGRDRIDVQRAGAELDKLLHTTPTEREALMQQHASMLQQRRQKAMAWTRRLRADEKPEGSIFVNGQVLPFHPQLFQYMHQVISMQIQRLAPLIYYRQLDEKQDMSVYFYDQPGAYTVRSELMFPPEDGVIKVKAIELSGAYADLGDVLTGPEAIMAVWMVGDRQSVAGQQMHDALLAAQGKQTFRLGHLMPSRLGLPDSIYGLLVNGKLVYNFDPAAFTAADFSALVEGENTKVDTVKQALGKDPAPWQVVVASSIVYAANHVDSSQEGFFATPSTARTTAIDTIQPEPLSFTVGDPSTAALRFSVLLDPLGGSVQRWSGVLSMLAHQPDVSIRVLLNPRANLTDVPLKRYYRSNVPHTMHFDAEGAVVPSTVHFTEMPQEAVLTMGFDAPPTWLTMPVEAIYDLDNIRLRDAVTSSVRAVYELTSILIEGHVRDQAAKSTPRGLQLVLQSIDGTQTLDTIVMANLAYFQFRAAPGVYRLGIRPGRSAKLYEMVSAGSAGWDSPTVAEAGDGITLDTFQGLTIFPRMVKRKGMEREVLVEDTSEGKPVVEQKETVGGAQQLLQKAQGLLSAAASSMLGQTDTTALTVPKQKQAQINVFTVASGHLYERMTYIMCLSVMKHTQSSVKFWFIENFLSPSFKSFIPLLAQEYGFDYELVTYAWPHWLRAQSEKQRAIWGMKVLFLDVLFPLDLSKVIFVDADQIVRADLLELVQLDLHGAPYGFPPMGNDSHDMDNFRFWESGYWKDYLRGKPYPISALFVVDLNRFRLVAAGDKLRGHYQALSADPGSLSNLDQDLVASMIHNVPIFSLDKEWLWCETWCSWEWYPQAKSIDLCSNPKTHEPKLDRARRQIPEWTPLDQEVAALARRLEEQGKLGANVVAAAGAAKAKASASSPLVAESAPVIDVDDPAEGTQTGHAVHDEL